MIGVNFGFSPVTGCHSYMNPAVVGTKTKGPPDYVSFCRAVKKQWFHTLKHRVQSQEQHNIALQTIYMLELDLGAFKTNGVCILPNDKYCHLLYV